MRIGNIQYRKTIGLYNSKPKLQNAKRTSNHINIFIQQSKSTFSQIILYIIILWFTINNVSYVLNVSNVLNYKTGGKSCDIGVKLMSDAKNYAKVTHFVTLNEYCWDFDFNLIFKINSKDLKYKYNNKNDLNSFIITYTSFSIILQKCNNKAVEIINGSFKVKHLKLLHTNKGPAYFENKIDDMAYIIDRYKPDIMAISESNISKRNLNFKNDFNDYNFELNKMYDIYGFSRNAIMVKQGISYKRRYDLENQNNCMIWIEIKINPRKSILFMGGYRQWTLLKSLNQANSGSNKQQIERLKTIIDSWERALLEKKR